jgi:DNA-binding winged helix-turn-helix (wHTH) protein/TolB-like protein/Flp pilus assembly protein TadD
VSTARHLYEFGPFRLDPVERRLQRNGEVVALTPKCFDVLVALVENRGHLIEKGDLLARVWPGQFVEEGNLSFNISELRKALGDGRGELQYIETVRTKGFRFVAPVQEIPLSPPELAVTQMSRRWIIVTIVALGALGWVAYIVWPGRTVAPAEGPPKTIAVLPFKPLTATMRDEPLEIGICDALINRLAGVEQLVVLPTGSVVAYNRLGQDPLDAGRKLHADALLDGYIQRSHDRIRVTARLLRTSDGKSLWTGEFNESFTDIFTVEDSISRKIVEALHLKLTRDERQRVTKHHTENIEAYDLYLKGQFFQDKRTREGLLKSIDYFQEATHRDPGYALAFAAMSDSWTVLAVRGDMPPAEVYEKAKAAASRAAEIDDSLAEAHRALANVKSWWEWDWPGAEREFKRAIELSANDPIPNQQYAGFLVTMGRHPEAISEIKRAQRLAPLSLTTNVQAARVLYFAGRYEESLEECRKTLDMDPNFAGAYMFLGRIHAQKGLYREALSELERARVLQHDSAEVRGLIGYTYAVSGRAGEAERVLKELRGLSKERYVSPYHVAMIYAGLGKRDDAFQWLEKAYDAREGRLTIVRFAPEFSSLRSDPRFTRLLQRMKLM